MINKQNRSKFLIMLIGILLIANIVLLSFFIMKKDSSKQEKRPDRKTMIAQFLKSEIGFDTLQLKAYDTLSTTHRNNVKAMFDELRSSKDKQFKQLTAGNFSDSVMEQVATQSAAAQKMMELKMFSHLKNIRQLCTEQQLPKFDSLFAKVLNRRGNGDGKKQIDNKK